MIDVRFWHLADIEPALNEPRLNRYDTFGNHWDAVLRPRHWAKSAIAAAIDNEPKF